MCFETFWVEIFSETRRAWTCFFEYLELIFASFFYLFFLKFPIRYPCLIGFNLKDWELIWKMVVFGKGIKFFGWMNKPNKKYKSYLSGQRIWYSFLDLIFEDAWKSVSSRSVQYSADYLKKRYGISFFAGAITVGFLANKKWYSYWEFWFCG